MMDDQVSDCDSLEVIDMEAEISEAIADAAKDESAMKKLEEERGSGNAMEKIPAALTTSQYAQVIFQDVLDSYTNSSDVECRYTITEGFRVANGDRIGLYRLPFLQPQEYIMFSWVQSVSEGSEGRVVFPAKDLPQEADFYQFQYIKFDGTVAGASVPWHLAVTAECGKQEGGVENEDLVMVQTPLSTLRLNNDVLAERVKDIEKKYSSILEMSEKLSEELNLKNASFVVLDSRYRSLLQERDQQAMEVKADIQTLVDEKLALEQKIHKANEGRSIAESEAAEMVLKVASLNEVLDNKYRELQLCEENRMAAEQEVKQLRDNLTRAEKEIEQLHSERASINTMLDHELTRRESCLAENQHLLARLEDTNAMLQETQKSKEKAITEIRCMVQEQDRLRREIQQFRDTIESLQMSKSLLEEEFVRTKDQLLELTRAEPPLSENHQDPAVQEVLAALGSKLEAAEQTSRDQVQQIKSLESALQTANEALDKQADVEYVSWQNEQLKGKLDEMTAKLAAAEKESGDQLNALQEENLNLKQRLQVGAEHYKKLALEKAQPISCNCQSYLEQIKLLSVEVKSLRSELQEGREESRMSLSELREAVMASEQQSLASTYSGDSNMDSMRIRSCMEQTGTRPRHPAIALSAIPQPGTQPAVNTPEESKNPGSLPQPLQPEKVEPAPATNTIRLACMLCDTTYSPWSVHECEKGASSLESMRKLECPVCDLKFEESISEEDIAKHVESHFSKECPFCYRLYETQEVLEAHVQTHMMSERGSDWDLGID